MIGVGWRMMLAPGIAFGRCGPGGREGRRWTGKESGLQTAVALPGNGGGGDGGNGNGGRRRHRAPMAALAMAVLAMAVAAPAPARATADGPDYYAVAGVAAGRSLAIRAEPSAAGRRIGAVPHDGRGLANLGCRGGPTFAEWQRMSASQQERARRQRWCKIRYQGIEGWVAGWHLAEDGGR